ncbi:MAG: hypothetical protein QW416_04070 [Candidatus Nitrosocaldaceae archaeon]
MHKNTEVVTIQIPKEIINSLNDKGVYNVQDYIINLISNDVKNDKVLSKEEQDILEENLKGLGYI